MYRARVVVSVLVQIARGAVLSTPRVATYVQSLRVDMVDSLRARTTSAFGYDTGVTCACQWASGNEIETKRTQ